MHHPLPFMIRHGDEDAASKASADLDHASVLMRHGHGGDEVAIEPIASKNNGVIVLEGQGGKEERHSSASVAYT